MPALPSCILDPLREQFLALVDIAQPAGIDTHPLGCHRPRIPDAIVFDRLVHPLVFGSGYERIERRALLSEHAASPPRRVATRRALRPAALDWSSTGGTSRVRGTSPR